jgi:hypothetical protein
MSQSGPLIKVSYGSYGFPKLRKRLKAGASCFELVPCWLGGEDFQRFEQTYPATFVWFGLDRCQEHIGGARSRRNSARMVRTEAQVTGTSASLDGEDAGVADDADLDLNQLELKACQRPFGHRLGQFDAAQKRG